LRLPEEEYHPDCVDEVWGSGRKSVMVWGAFCGELKSPLYVVPPGTTLDSEKYTKNVLDPLLIPFWHQTCEVYGWSTVVEDGAPGHQKYAIQCRKLNNLETLPWPPQSPDLNLIEALWADMETELGQIYERATNTDDLILMLHAAWGNINSERLLKLVDSMPARLAAVIAAEGNATPY